MKWFYQSLVYLRSLQCLNNKYSLSHFQAEQVVFLSQYAINFASWKANEYASAGSEIFIAHPTRAMIQPVLFSQNMG